TPRTAAASLSSCERTAPRSLPSRSDGSATDPRSPREAHRSTTRAPPSASRASVPPQASDSSSGWAKTARTVRPASDRPGSAAAGTMGLHDSAVDGDVLADHARDAEPLDGAIAHPAAVERQHARQVRGHLLQIAEHDPGHAVVDEFAHGAAVE